MTIVFLFVFIYAVYIPFASGKEVYTIGMVVSNPALKRCGGCGRLCLSSNNCNHPPRGRAGVSVHPLRNGNYRVCCPTPPAVVCAASPVFALGPGAGLYLEVCVFGHLVCFLDLSSMLERSRIRGHRLGAGAPGPGTPRGFTSHVFVSARAPFARRLV